ncbi:unnamed protein product [Rangifer tarandus platyrhynchus]|uniref:Uncharacterized protein n=2 Tax=Rangifer tarandus platyrhynchus TaxID=3082113 RepID=A0AC59Z8Y0_RANTA
MTNTKGDRKDPHYAFSRTFRKHGVVPLPTNKQIYKGNACRGLALRPSDEYFQNKQLSQHLSSRAVRRSSARSVQPKMAAAGRAQRRCACVAVATRLRLSRESSAHSPLARMPKRHFPVDQ